MDFETQLAELLKPFPIEQYTMDDCNSDDCPDLTPFMQKQIDGLAALAKSAWDQRNKAYDLNDLVTEQRDKLTEELDDERYYIKQLESDVKEYEALLEAERAERLKASEFVYSENKRLSAIIDQHLTESANAKRKYLELVAMIVYYTEDNKGFPYCRDIRGEVAKAAAAALKEMQTAKG